MQPHTHTLESACHISNKRIKQSICYSITDEPFSDIHNFHNTEQLSKNCRL